MVRAHCSNDLQHALHAVDLHRIDRLNIVLGGGFCGIGAAASSREISLAPPYDVQPCSDNTQSRQPCQGLARQVRNSASPARAPGSRHEDRSRQVLSDPEFQATIRSTWILATAHVFQ